MKKLFIFILASLCFVAAHSQTSKAFTTVAGDTVSTSSSLDTVSKVLHVTAGYSSAAIQVNATKVSGTITAKAYLYSSLDGTNYVLTDSASAAFANAAGTQVVLFSKTPAPYEYYKVQVRNVGGTTSTEALAVKVYYLVKRYDRTL